MTASGLRLGRSFFCCSHALRKWNQATKRWPIERTNSWMNGYGKLRRMTDRNPAIVVFYLYLAAAFVTIRQLIQRARNLYRWDTRPTTKRLK